jgi:mannose-6-phosphate isomerase-like protein (cupin superfamily)
MMAAVRKRFDQPDEMREFSNGIVAGVELAGSRVAKATFQPGWRWSESVKPIVGGESCQMHHVGYALSGSLHVVTGDGEEMEIAAGDAYEIEPGHDAWVVGEGAFEGLEFDPRTVETYAKPT